MAVRGEANETPEAIVDATMRAIEAGASGAGLVAMLDERCDAFVTTDLIHRLVPFARRLQGLDFSSRPRGGVVAGVALCAIDRPAGRRLITGSREALADAGDAEGEGFGCFLEGLEDLGEGRLDSAVAWWDRSRDLLGPDHPIEGFTMANRSLGAYQAGSLVEAVALAERALASAELRGDARQEAIAGIYVSFFRIWTGDFARADLAGGQAQRALDRLPETDRYDAPLVWAQLGAVAGLRGQRDAAASAFAAAVATAARFQNEWHDAMVRSGRAEFLTTADPLEALADVRRALDYFERVDEQWWANWARQALAVTHLRLGDLAAADATCRVLLGNDLNELEHGRALLVHGELAARAGNAADAIERLTAAADLLGHAGADFWAARAEILAAGVDRRRSTFLVRSAERRAGSRRGDPAWSRMLAGPGALRIDVLGGVSVTIDGRPVTFTTHAEEEALAMLVAAWPRGVRAELIADRLWPQATGDKAVHRCDNLLSSLRGALLPTTRIRRAKGVVSIDLWPHECDLLELRAGTGETASARGAEPFLGDAPPQWAVAVQVDLEVLAASPPNGGASEVPL